MSWSTDFSKLLTLKRDTKFIVQRKDGDNFISCVHGAEGEVKFLKLKECGGVAWHPMPEPYRPPKPEQITTESALWNLYRKEIVAAIEKRTREIVEWESVYE